MEFIGKWRVKKSIYPTEDGMKHLTKEELIAAGVDDEDALQMFDAIIEIKENGAIDTLIQVPEEMLEEAKAQGADVDENGCVKVESTTWSEKDGRYYYFVGGEDAPLELNEDGLLPFAMGMMLLERV
jgi:hypothetical protein